MSQRSVHLIEQLANRSYLIICINPIYLLDITKPRRILWHPPQRWVHSPRSDHVIACDAVDALELVFCCNQSD
jgi:hypothetical protein